MGISNFKVMSVVISINCDACMFDFLILSCNIVDVMYSAWKQVLDPCDLKWISQALFRVNRQGKAEMKFDHIDRMWFYPPKPALVCTQPPAMDR